MILARSGHAATGGRRVAACGADFGDSVKGRGYVVKALLVCGHERLGKGG